MHCELVKWLRLTHRDARVHVVNRFVTMIIGRLQLKKMHSYFIVTLTYSVSFTEMTRYHVVHIVILTQVQFQQIDFHFTMLDKHAMFNHLGRKTKQKYINFVN